jgi:hypothetical protein
MMTASCKRHFQAKSMRRWMRRWRSILEFSAPTVTHPSLFKTNFHGVVRPIPHEISFPSFSELRPSTLLPSWSTLRRLMSCVPRTSGTCSPDSIPFTIRTKQQPSIKVGDLSTMALSFSFRAFRPWTLSRSPRSVSRWPPRRSYLQEHCYLTPNGPSRSPNSTSPPGSPSGTHPNLRTLSHKPYTSIFLPNSLLQISLFLL